MSVHVSPKHKLLGVPFSNEVRNLFPAAKSMEFNGAEHLLLPHGPTETFILRKLGYTVPAPILTHYDWAGGKPFEVQKKTCALLSLNERAYVLNDMGTGKTKALLWAWDYLRSNNLCGRLLILAPLSTLRFTWEREVFNTIPHRRCAVVHGDRKRRLALLNNPDVEIFILNHDGLKVVFDDILKMPDLDVLGLDELAVYRNGQADRTKLTRKLAQKMKWVWGMTGAPIPHEPTDAWAEASIVTPHTVPKYFSRFRDELMQRVTQFKWVPKQDAVERAFAALQPAVRFSLDDVVELPDCVEQFVDVDLAPSTAKIYKALVDDCYAAIQSQEITAANAGAVMMKLLQVSSGWVYTKDGGTISLDNQNRIDAMLDAINASGRKVLVFAPFKHALAGISETLTKNNIEHATVSGDTPPNDRAQIFNAFQNTNKYRTIAAHPQCLAHGVTLTAADTIIWFAPVTSLEIYDQANRRIRRIGQQHKQLVLHLQSTPVERRIYSLLRAQQKVQEKLLELFEEASRA
ncbi:MAG TPA: DEAD/DEAH box helicase [Xanthobacteraceae bacterium]|nr:DEAD/DEAH box helicase [Xanthobacteraceae bacterium]